MPPPIPIPCTAMKLIEEVKKRPGLWSQEHALEPKERRALWQEVGAASDPDWSRLSKAASYDLVSNLQKRWRSIRDAYKRETRRRRAGLQNVTYVFYDQMRFLDGGVDDNGDSQNLSYKTEDIEETMDHLSEENNQILSDNSTNTVNSKKKIVKKRKRNSEKDIFKLVEEEDASLYETEHQFTHIPAEIEHLNVENDYSDTDKLFMLSFLPEMRGLPLRLRMWARAEIANVMQKAVYYHIRGKEPTKKKEPREPNEDLSDSN